MSGFSCRTRLPVRLIAASLAVASSLFASPQAQSPTRARTVSLSAAADSVTFRQIDLAITGMLRDGRLRRTTTETDGLTVGIEHERLQQMHRGVAVWASGLARQMRAGVPVSSFGDVFDALDAVETTPTITADEARSIVARDARVALGANVPVTLVVYVDGTNAARLAYTVRAATPALLMYRFFIDAHTGAVIERRLDTRTQAAVGVGRGVIGDLKKVSASQRGGLFVLADLLRPQQLQTFDLRGDVGAVLEILNGIRPLTSADLGADGDNDWPDPALVDAHVYSGWTYDYLFKRFNRRGLDGSDLPVINIVHPARREDFELFGTDFPQFFANAGYFGNGVQIYGDGLPDDVVLFTGQRVDYLSGAIDIVGHEVAHGLTEHLEYLGESGALTETFSDIIGTSVEFYFQPAGAGRGVRDYQIGEDAVSFGAIRSMSNPAAIAGHPTRYQDRYLGPEDNGGVHVNAGIGNMAFFLAIEGGTHPTTGVAVTGVGAANREQIEKVVYRAFTQMLPPRATFSIARAATLQAARDLYGVGSAAETAMAQAWTAVGVE